ncbi:hypothetical protein GCM10009801_53240 [Streptomyces albiaxialis]|uniref:histidine kinase n=1 Tax=Streptomyces albiaxialis TaxID=329523 RepID=A0ABN2WFC0_9ACTN
MIRDPFLPSVPPAHVRVLRAALQAAPLGVLCQGTDGRIVAANDALGGMFGLGPECDISPGAPARTVLEEIARRYVPGHPAARTSPRDHAPRIRRVTEIPLRDGRVVNRETVPLQDGDAHVGFLWTYRDVTEAKRTEHDLRRDNEDLERVLRERREFTATASHELRTPLAAVVSFCELLADPASGTLDVHQRDFLAAIARNAEHMRQVITRLLPASGAPGGAAGPHGLELGEVRVPRLLDHALAARTAAMEEAGVFLTVRCADGPPLRGDEHLLERVVTNLLGNAAKYTAAGGDVRLTAAPRGAAWEIEVADTGIGVPEESRNAIFQTFARAPNAERGGYPGSGIGLAVSHDIVRLHGGTLTVGGTEGEGAVFRLRLPLAGPDGGERAA